MSTERYDSGDLDAIRELKHSPGFALYSKRVNEELERRRLELETAEKHEYVRGLVRSLRIVIDIPAFLEDEIKSQVGKE